MSDSQSAVQTASSATTTAKLSLIVKVHRHPDNESLCVDRGFIITNANTSKEGIQAIEGLVSKYCAATQKEKRDFMNKTVDSWSDAAAKSSLLQTYKESFENGVRKMLESKYPGVSVEALSDNDYKLLKEKVKAAGSSYPHWSC